MNQNEKLMHAIGGIDDNLIAEADKKVASKKIKLRWVAPIAAALALTVAVGAGYQLRDHGGLTTTPPPGYTDGVGNTSPMEMRRFFNYNGLRYAYESNLIPDQYLELENEVAEITADLSTDPEKLAAADLAGTFLPGSKIYSIKGQSPDLRLAVSDGEKVYVCQVTDTLSGEGLDLASFFQNTGIFENTLEIIVFDHFGQELLKELDQTAAQQLLSLMEDAQKAKLSNEQYEQIGAMQTNGKSFSVECSLNDGTQYQFYAIPELGLVMVGDNIYELTAEGKDAFASLLAN